MGGLTQDFENFLKFADNYLTQGHDPGDTITIPAKLIVSVLRMSLGLKDSKMPETTPVHSEVTTAVSAPRKPSPTQSRSRRDMIRAIVVGTPTIVAMSAQSAWAQGSGGSGPYDAS